ncbi:hypothetical protein A11A3_16637 [Alcanivorax hongdengensis A-11-3]|uniref:Uncharacterized protein n=1 Tax=Alcanivorax hongdengensis A-11-3 TaxID=1177179 RepID=L0W9S9_9GAMM|nr:hypothetical protein A11A3_16637 [Alcanivorax hongdengensis A-11-3]
MTASRRLRIPLVIMGDNSNITLFWQIAIIQRRFATLTSQQERHILRRGTHQHFCLGAGIPIPANKQLIGADTQGKITDCVRNIGDIGIITRHILLIIGKAITVIVSTGVTHCGIEIKSNFITIWYAICI